MTGAFGIKWEQAGDFRVKPVIYITKPCIY